MSFDDFLDFLKKWIDRINEINKKESPDSNDFIVMDKDYFDYCNESKTYTLKESAIEKWKTSCMLFVADNPGEQEKKHFQYLYYNCCYNGYYRTSGYKYDVFLKNLNLDRDKVVRFNKCLISTPRTKDLSADQIEKTKEIVCSFIKSFHKTFPETFILFSGIAGIKSDNSVFSQLYSGLSELLIDNNVGWMGHISRKKFPEKKEIADKEDLMTIAVEYKQILFEAKKDIGNDTASSCDDCAFYIYCTDCDDNGDDGGGGDDGLTPETVHA